MSIERLGNGLGDSLGLSLTWESQKLINLQKHEVGADDRRVLRELAKRVAELAARPIEDKKRKLWYAHNALESVRPLVFCDPENGWYEIIPHTSLKCSGSLARIWEFGLRKEIFWGEKMGDDRVTDGGFAVQYVFSQSGRGLEQTIIGGENDGAYTWDPPLKDYKALDDLSFSRIEVDKTKTNSLFELAAEIFEGILPIRLEGCWWWSLGMTFDAISLIGAEKIMTDMYDCPDGLHRLMAFLRDENLAKLDYLEKNGYLTQNNKGTYVGSGGFGWTVELPQKDFDGKNTRTLDMWGFGESQETVGVSPDMFEEFVFLYQLPLLEKFGLNCYGCCEALDKRWRMIEKTPRLRRVSVSNWAKEEAMGEQLCGNYIYSRKAPSASIAIPVIDKDQIKKGLRNTLDISRRNGCVLEIIMKDNHTIGHNPQNVVDWCKIAQQEAQL